MTAAIEAQRFESRIHNVPVTEINQPFLIHIPLQYDLAKSRLPFYNADRTGKSPFGKQTGKDGIVGDEPEAKILCHGAFFSIRVEDAQWETAAGADADGICNLILIKSHELPQSGRHIQSPPCVGGPAPLIPGFFFPAG